MTERCDQVDVPADMSRLLCALKYGWEPHPFELGEVKEIKLGEMEASDLAAKLHFERDRLKATEVVPRELRIIVFVTVCLRPIMAENEVVVGFAEAQRGFALGVAE